MVSKKELLNRIEKLEKENARMLKSIIALNKKYMSMKNDNDEEPKIDKTNAWLSDDRIDNAQAFLNKGD